MTRQIQEVTTVNPGNRTQVIRTSKVTQPEVNEGRPQTVYETKKTIFRAYQVIWYILGFIEILLAFRFVFRAIGANPFSPFVAFIYTLSAPFAYPFQGILVSSIYGASVVEWSTIIGAVIYLIVAYGLVELFQFFKPVSQDEVEEKVDEE